MTTQSLEVRAVQYTLEVPIEAPVDRVWAALTEETNAWWLPDFHMVGADSIVTFEARAGGKLVEEKADGGSLLWYTVQMCTPGESIHLVGHIAPNWGGPATSMLELKLEADGAGTRLIVNDALFGRVGETTPQSLRDGWGQLFGEGLAKHVAG